MRKIVSMMSVSLDGFIEDANRSLGWQTVDEELHLWFNQHLRTAGAFLDGRVTYELMADYWPTADQDRSGSPAVIEFAGIWRDMPKIVYSRTLQHADWNSTIVRDVVPDDVRALQAQSDGDLVVGGADLLATFIEHDLVDEYWLYFHPVVIGAGKPFFPPAASFALELVETRVFGSGVVLLRYGRPRLAAAGLAAGAGSPSDRE